MGPAPAGLRHAREVAAVNGQDELNVAVPPIALGGAFLAMLAYISVRAEFFPHPGHELAKFSEWLETCFALALAVFALLAWRRVDAGQ